MTFYLTQCFCGKLRKFCIFFIAVLAFSAESIVAQNLLTLFPEHSKEKRTEFVNAALEYLGTPYARGGTTRGGMDCSGLVFRVGRDVLGKKLPRSASAIAKYAEKIPDDEIELGDLLFFAEGGGISHVSIYIGEGDFVHSASRGPRTGVIVSSISESYWKRTYRYAGRILPAKASAKEAVSSAENKSTSNHIQQRVSSAPSVSIVRLSADASISDLEQASINQNKSYGLRVELRGTALWDFNFEEKLIRGTTASVTAQWRGSFNLYPGLTTGFSWDTRHGTMSVPLYLSASMKNGLAFFAGTQFIFYSGGNGSTEFFFPGIIGASWTSPYKSLGAVKIGFYQSIECVFVRREDVAGEMLSDVFRLSTGVTFAIGT